MAFEQTSNPQYSEFIQLSRYSRWLPEEGRRETWAEVIDRWMKFWLGKFPEHAETLQDLAQGIYNLEYMPSMRTLMTAGEALERDHVAGYNCAYRAIGTGVEQLKLTSPKFPDETFTIPLKDVRAFDEVLYVLMCGTGAGFSVERQYINLLPTVGKTLSRSVYRRTNKNYPGVDKDELSYFQKASNTVRVADSKYGWASALRIFLVELYNGNFDIEYDTSGVREEGAALKTFGGRASGPRPLEKLLDFVRVTFMEASGRKLNSLECHDITCMIAEIVVVGGVRRSALISLSNLTDERMAGAKLGRWYDENTQRALANNSVCYTEKPDIGIFMREWKNLYDSKSGERGIFNREAAKQLSPARRDTDHDFGCNPCSEIVLRDQQFCNLSEVVVRASDTLEVLKKKVRAAAIIGTLQASLTDFKYLNPLWKKNCEEEALIGVSLTGIMDHSVMGGASLDDEYKDSFGIININGGTRGLPGVLEELREIVNETNKEWAEKIGINRAAATNCIKPSGTVSQLVDSSSGIHARHHPYYIRTVRADKKDPLAQLMVEQGFPHEDDLTKPDSVWVFSFPIKAPEGAIFREDRTALEQLELWLIYQRHWCEHKPSVTINVKEHEWLQVQAWVYDHFDEVSGISFLPHDGGQYQQAPYQDLTEAEYNEWQKRMPKGFDWNMLGQEEEDTTKGTQEYACSGGVCEVVDLV